jgi:hypothetical protein
MQVQLLPRAPLIHIASVVQQTERPITNRQAAGAIPAGSTNLQVIQNTNPTPLKTRKDIEEKKILAKDRERSQLHKLQRRKVILDKPVQKGWMRCYFLTEEAQKRSDASTLEAILREVNVVCYHWRRNFLPTNRNRRAQIQRMNQPLQSISHRRWVQRSFPHEWRSYFVREFFFDRFAWDHRFVFRWPRLFEVRVVPRMVTRLPVCDPSVESRLSEVQRFFEDPRKSGKLCKLRGCYHYWKYCDERRKLGDRLAWKRIRAAMAGDVEAEMKPSTTWFHLCLPFARVVQQQRQPA